MSAPHCLPADLYGGKMDGISIRWTASGRSRLPGNARQYGKEVKEMKSVTEKLAFDCAKRLKKRKAQILGSFHGSTKDGQTGGQTVDEVHCTLRVNPGQVKVHIYVNLTAEIALSDMQVLAESVVLPGGFTPDPRLSVYFTWPQDRDGEMKEETEDNKSADKSALESCTVSW